jgi:prophage antirepressor-like protein
MATALIDTIRKLLIFEGNEIYIAFKSGETDPYFYGKQVCDMLEYENSRLTIKKYVSDRNKFYLKDIVKNYKILYKNVQGHTVFINEVGLYQLINKSRSDRAEDIRNWIESDVLPSLRKHGEFRLKESDQAEKIKLEKELTDAKIELEKRDNEIDVLKFNLKQPKLKKGNVVYIIREIVDTLKFGRTEVLKLKLGKSGDLKARKNTLDTSAPLRFQVLKSVVVKDKEAVESCWKNKMSKWLIIGDKEYCECSYDQMIEQLAICINFFEGTDIDTSPDKQPVQSRETTFDEKFDTTKVIKMYFEDDTEEVSDHDSSDDDMKTSDSEDYQTGGGGRSDRMGYLKYKLKYLILLDELK